MKCIDNLQHCVCDNNNDYSSQSSIMLPATIFDFKKSNVDFENGEPDPVTVATELGSDGKSGICRGQ